MKKIILLILFISQTLFIYAEWNKNLTIQNYIENYNVQVEVWVNYDDGMILFEDSHSDSESELFYNINYIISIYSFFLQDNPDVTFKDYNIIYLYYLQFKNKEYRLDIILKNNILKIKEKEQTKAIISSYATAQNKFKEKYYRSIEEIWMLKRLNVEQSIQGRSDLGTQSLDSFKK